MEQGGDACVALDGVTIALGGGVVALGGGATQPPISSERLQPSSEVVRLLRMAIVVEPSLYAQFANP